jgi:hypothetical protein
MSEARPLQVLIPRLAAPWAAGAILEAERHPREIQKRFVEKAQGSFCITSVWIEPEGRGRHIPAISAEEILESVQAGLAEARRLGITESDGAYDVEGWDSAAKTAALANVLMNARTTPQQVTTRGITRLTPERVMEIARGGKTVRLVSRAKKKDRH